MTHYLSVAQVLAIHDQAINRYGGSPGLRDLGLLESALGRPQASMFGEDAYPDLFEKAAALLHSLLKNHPFVDGNKRTALSSCAIFLHLNGYLLINKHKETIAFALQVENEGMALSDIGIWLKKHTKRIER